MDFGGEDEGGDGLAWGEDPADAEPRRIASLRRRIDGFTPERQRRFLGALVETGCIADSARIAGVSTTTIDRVRRKFADFDAKCRAALDLAVPNLEAIAYRRATVGAPEKVIRKGRLVEVRIKPSDSMLRTLLAGAAPAKYGRWAGLPDKSKDHMPPLPTAEQARESILRKIHAIRRHQVRSGTHVVGPDGSLLPRGMRLVSVEELKRLGWQAPEGEAPPLPEDGG